MAPAPDTRSYTWLECEHALKLRYAAAVQNAVESGDINAVLAATNAVTQLAAFRKRLLTRHAGHFSNEHERGKLVLHALVEWRKTRPQFGPAPAGDPTAYLEALRASWQYVGIEAIKVSDGVKRQFEMTASISR